MLACAVAFALHAAPAAAKLDWKDFWDISGVTRDDKKADVIKKWGKPDEDKPATSGGTVIRYHQGPSIDFRSDGATQIDFSSYSAADFIAAHPSPPLALVDMPCDAAAKRLAFAKKIDRYTTCKHYDASGWLLDITLMCSAGKVSTLVVVWLSVPELKTMKQLPADHC